MKCQNSDFGNYLTGFVSEKCVQKNLSSTFAQNQGTVLTEVEDNWLEFSASLSLFVSFWVA